MKSAFRNWSDVRVFLAVVREGSTLAASKILDIAQPTVARRIEALEHETGLTLFERGTRGFRPTEAAKRLMPLAEAIEAAAQSFSSQADEMTRPRPIRITAFSGNFSDRATQIFSDFSAFHPEVPFEFLPTVATLDLKAGEADVALRLVRSLPDPDLICRRISTARWTLYGSPAYRDKHGLPATTEDLAGHVFATFQRDGVANRLHEWIVARVQPNQIASTFREYQLFEAAVKSGAALGIMNLRMVGDAPNLIACFDPPAELDAEHLMLVSPEAWRRPEVKAFTRFFAPRYAALYR